MVARAAQWIFAIGLVTSSVLAKTPVDYTLAPITVAEERDAGPARIVSVAPSITEICAALGLSDRIVGRTQFCLHPPIMRNVDIVGAQVDLNLEQVIKLKPDLVLITDGSAAKLAGPLERMGLKVQSIPDQTIEDIFVAIHKVGSLCQRPKSATALAAALRRDLERLSRLDQDPRKRAVLAINPLPPAPGALFVAGPGGHLHTLLALAGCDNAADRVVKRPWAEIGVETLVIAAPDCIIEYRPAGVPLNIDSLYDGWRGLATVPAIGQRCVRRLPDNTALVPGPRINIALHQLIELLND